MEAWHGLEKLRADGKVRAIGLSNFKPAHTRRVLAEASILPDIDQIEVNPLVTRDETRAFHNEHGIVTESWSPLGASGRVRELLATAPITEAARTHGKTPARDSSCDGTSSWVL